MKKIIGRGVLLLEIAPAGPGLKFGYQLSSAGIELFSLGGNSTPLSLREAVSDPTTSVKGSGYLILNDLPASPNDAFYKVSFDAQNIGEPSESFTLKVTETGAFAHGPQYHFSGLDLTFEFKKGGLTIPGGSVKFHLDQGVFDGGKTLDLVPGWNQESETLIFKLKETTTEVQMDSIGKLKGIEIEVGSDYDRWAQVQALYTFEGGLAPTGSPASQGEIVTHDISGQGAPSLFFEGKENFNKNQALAYGAKWKERGIAFGGDSILASPTTAVNPVVDSILENQTFSVEIWIKPTKPKQQGPARIFAIEGTGSNKDNFLIGQGPWDSGSRKIDPVSPGAYLNVNFRDPQVGAVAGSNALPSAKPFKSPADSLLRNPANADPIHVVYSYDRDKMKRIFINGVLVAERFDSDYYIGWSKMLQLVVGNALDKKNPWEGEVHQLAIFDRALTAEEVNLHYQPVVKITGDFSLDHVIAPLAGVGFPCKLNIRGKDSSLIAAKTQHFDINARLGFRQVYLECTKLPAGHWIFSGKFQTRIWDDLVNLDAHLDASGHLNLASPIDQPEWVNTSKYSAVHLLIGAQNVWELSFGAHLEIAVVPFVLENILLSYEEFRMGNPRLVLADPATVEGIWLEENIIFTSSGTGAGRVLKGSTEFSLPFTLELPPAVDPETGDAWGDAILLDQAVMTISLEVTLKKDGFLGVVNAGFNFEGKPMSLPERRIYTAPASKMALLGEILEEVKTRADTLFAGFRKHPEDYYLAMKTGGPYIHLSRSETEESTIESILPRIFTANPPAAFVSPAAKPTFELSQSPSTCKITLNLSGVEAPGVRTAFDDLMKQVEGQKGLSSGGLRLLQNRIAERLPLDFDALLYYHYGWDIAKNYIDLHPGMRLRVDFQNYQFVHATEQRAKKGFTGGGSITIPINSYTDDGAQFLGFGPFVSRLRADNADDISREGAGGLFDLVKTGIRKKFFRLFFPKKPAPERPMTIIGADRWQDMPVEIPVTTTDNLISFFFRDKAMVIPEIQVFVGNREVYVPVGTTVRQLIEQYANIPMASDAKPDLRAFLGKARPRRLIHTGANNVPEYRFLNFNTGNSVVKNQDAFDLPLIKGDKFYF